MRVNVTFLNSKCHKSKFEIIMREIFSHGNFNLRHRLQTSSVISGVELIWRRGIGIELFWRNVIGIERFWRRVIGVELFWRRVISVELFWRRVIGGVELIWRRVISVELIWRRVISQASNERSLRAIKNLSRNLSLIPSQLAAQD